jgi:hypothetical protein
MSKFAAQAKEACAAGRTIKLESWVFPEEWTDRPKSTVCVGIRLISEGEKAKAMAQSEEVANSLHDQNSGPESRDLWRDAFNNALIRQVAAVGICDPNDVMKPTELFPLAEEQVRFALTSAGARFIFDQIERYEIEVSEAEPSLTEDQLDEFAASLFENFDRLLPQHKRLLNHVFDQLRS